MVLSSATLSINNNNDSSGYDKNEINNNTETQQHQLNNNNNDNNFTILHNSLDNYTNNNNTEELLIEEEDTTQPTIISYQPQQYSNNNNKNNTNNANNNNTNNFFNKKNKKLKKLNYIYQCFSATHVLLILFIFQGIFALIISFSLLYSSSLRIISQHNKTKQLQITSLINYKMNTFLNQVNLVTQHMQHQMIASNSFYLNNFIDWAKLFDYMQTVYGKVSTSLYMVGFYDNTIFIMTKRLVGVYSPYVDKLYVYYRLDLSKESNVKKLLTTENLYNTINVTYSFNDRSFYLPYSKKNMSVPMWSDFVPNLLGTPNFSAVNPLYINQSVDDFPSFFEERNNITLSNNNINNIKSSNLYGLFALQFSITSISELIAYQDFDGIFVMNSRGIVLTNATNVGHSVSIIRTVADEIKETIIENLKSCDLIRRNNGTLDSKYFYMSIDNTVYKIEYYLLCEKYGINWGVVFITEDLDLFKTLVKTDNTSVILFILFYLFALFFVFLSIKLISTKLNNISKTMIKLIHLEVTNELNQNNNKNIFHDIKIMENSLIKLHEVITTFSKFVPEIIVKKIMRNENHYDQIGMTNQYLTVMFVNIGGFINILNQMTIDTFLLFTTEYFNNVNKIIQERGGLIDKYIGDSVMSIFNEESFPVKNHEINACYAAFDILNIINDLNRKWNVNVTVGIGINSGNMLCGNIGSSTRMNFTSIGDNVNIGARLQTLNKIFNTRIIIGENTYEKVKDVFICYFIDYIALKGKDKAINVYSLQNIKQESNDLERKIEKDLNLIRNYLFEHRFQQMITLCEKIINFVDNGIILHLMNRAKDLIRRKDNGELIVIKSTMTQK
ncbi:hypothetical protein ABK040_002331 [Willaertia magna]